MMIHREEIMSENFIFMVPCIVTLYYEDPTICNSIHAFIY